MPTVDEPPTAQSMFRTRPLQAGASHSDIVTTTQVKSTVINAVIVFYSYSNTLFHSCGFEPSRSLYQWQQSYTSVRRETQLFDQL